MSGLDDIRVKFTIRNTDPNSITCLIDLKDNMGIFQPGYHSITSRQDLIRVQRSQTLTHAIKSTLYQDLLMQNHRRHASGAQFRPSFVDPTEFADKVRKNAIHRGRPDNPLWFSLINICNKI